MVLCALGDGEHGLAGGVSGADAEAARSARNRGRAPMFLAQMDQHLYRHMDEKNNLHEHEQDRRAAKWLPGLPPLQLARALQRTEAAAQHCADQPRRQVQSQSGRQVQQPELLPENANQQTSWASDWEAQHGAATKTVSRND